MTSGATDSWRPPVRIWSSPAPLAVSGKTKIVWFASPRISRAAMFSRVPRISLSTATAACSDCGTGSIARPMAIQPCLGTTHAFRVGTSTVWSQRDGGESWRKRRCLQRFLDERTLRPYRCFHSAPVSGTCGNGRNLGQRLAAQSLGLDGEPAPLVVREPETLAPKPGSEHTVLLLQVVDHILLLAVDPAS